MEDASFTNPKLELGVMALTLQSEMIESQSMIFDEFEEVFIVSLILEDTNQFIANTTIWHCESELIFSQELITPHLGLFWSFFSEYTRKIS